MQPAQPTVIDIGVTWSDLGVLRETGTLRIDAEDDTVVILRFVRIAEIPDEATE